MSFLTKLTSRMDSVDSHVCVGLDSRYDKLPSFITKNVSISKAIFAFNQHIIESTHHAAVAFKSNVSFYAGFGAEGLEGLRLTNEYLKKNHPTIPLLADCKRSEMGESVAMVKKEVFNWLGFDCVMVTPWFGQDTVTEYLKDDLHGVCVYVHDSNPTAPEIQAVELANGQKLFEYLTERVATVWNTNGNVFVEAGATFPVALKKVREIVGQDMPMLTAGIGPQGGKVEDLVGVFGAGGRRLFVNSSRGILFAGVGETTSKSYFKKAKLAAEKLRDELRKASSK